MAMDPAGAIHGKVLAPFWVVSAGGVREELVLSPTLLKRQDSSQIKLGDGKVRIFLANNLINAAS